MVKEGRQQTGDELAEGGKTEEMISAEEKEKEVKPKSTDSQIDKSRGTS
jgi:hypothetical protein